MVLLLHRVCCIDPGCTGEEKNVKSATKEAASAEKSAAKALKSGTLSYMSY